MSTQRTDNLTLPPPPLTALLGRERELDELCALLRDPHVRLVTLTGPGGVGKTRLALQAAASLAPTLLVVHVPLAAISDARLVVSAIAQALGLRESDEQPLLQRIHTALVDCRALLLLDNFEQVIEATPMVAGILAVCQQVTLLVTSRTVLNLAAEHRFAVPPLALPPDASQLDPAALVEHPAVALFVERAHAVRSGFQLNADNAPLIVDICRKLEGLPLAIELAAARLNLLSPQALRDRLSNRLALLTSGPRDLPPHQQTLRKTIDWSYDLLPNAEQRAFAQLSVFAGSWTLDAAEAVLGSAALETLSSLLDKSMIVRADEADGEPRFAMLETIREYALEQLAATGEAEVRARHAAYYAALAERAGQQLTGPSQQRWLDRLEQAHDNIRAALHWSRTIGDCATVARIAGAIWRFWHVHGHVSEGRQWLALAIDHCAALSSDLQATIRNGAGWLANVQGDIAQAEMHFAESLRLARSIDDACGIGLALGGLGRMAHLRDDAVRATALYEESLALLRSHAATEEVAWTLIRLGIIALEHGDYARAETQFAESRDAFASVGFLWGQTWASTYLGDVALARGTHELAAQIYRACFGEFERLGDRESAASLQARLDRPSPVHLPAKPSADDLTPREREVLRLVATGLTDAQVAQQLCVSPRTIHAHLRSIYAKLGVATRSAMTRLAIERELV